MKRVNVSKNSIIMDNCLIDIDKEITDSIIGPYSVIATNQEGKPRGYRFVIGERSKVII